MILSAAHITKSFGDQVVLDNLSLSINEFETLSILGRSGSGKTTLLKTLAGIHKQDEGEVLLDGQNIHDIAAHERNIVYLYQEALLFPHLNVYENVAFGLKLRRINDNEVKERTLQMLHSLELGGMDQKMPHELSGGQKQRVSFGRALIINPKVLLLDEPFGSLDVGTRGNMQQLFKVVSEQYNITALFVTHDLKEAIVMGNRIGLMEHGKLNIYESIEAFINDANTGVTQEIDFWNSLRHK